MPSLTPSQRSDEVTSSAMTEGLISGGLALIPSTGAVFLAMKTSPRFVKATNWQSRTAIAIMPALFAFAYASENKLIHRMHEVAEESEHSRNVAEWAHEKHKDELMKSSKTLKEHLDMEDQLTQLYRSSVEQSGVRIVPGDRLGMHHRAANYWQENPFKVLAFLGVPTVGYIFYGRSGQQHLPFQLKVMHTRVMGQFAVISLLLSLMGFKEYMDRNGKFITETEANARVDEMKRVRHDLILRMEAEKQAKLALQEELHKAHEEDVREGHVHTKPAKKHHKKLAEPLPTTLETPVVATISTK